jgi:serine/threonine protein phosphatase PrpC
MGNVLIAAVADGAGSAAMSDVGSSLAAEKSVSTAERLLREHHDHSHHPLHETCLTGVITEGVEDARIRLQQESENRGVDIRQLGTTLLLVVHAPGVLAAGQIGDGAMVVSDGADAYTTLISPQRGEYANQTNFLTSSDAMTSLDVRVERVEGSCPRLAMFTDGIQNLVLDSADDSPHPPFFDPVFDWLLSDDHPDDPALELAAFLGSPMITNRSDDDLTLLVATLME